MDTKQRAIQLLDEADYVCSPAYNLLNVRLALAKHSGLVTYEEKKYGTGEVSLASDRYIVVNVTLIKVNSKLVAAIDGCRYEDLQQLELWLKYTYPLPKYSKDPYAIMRICTDKDYIVSDEEISDEQY